MGTPALGFYALAGLKGASEIHCRGVTDQFIDDYESSGRHCDPLLAQVRASPAPAASSIEKLVRMSAVYSDFSNRHEIAQYLLAPIVAGGSVVGTLNFARYNECEFTEADIRIATVISLHVSTRIAVLRGREAAEQEWRNVLPRRELEVADLAVRGFSVSQIGHALGISPNTVKKYMKAIYGRLDVATRAELASAFVAGPAAYSHKFPGWRSRSGPNGALVFRW